MRKGQRKTYLNYPSQILKVAVLPCSVTACCLLARTHKAKFPSL